MSTGASLERLAVTQDAAGSSPVAPANSLLSTLLSMHVRKHFSAPSGRGRSFFLDISFYRTLLHSNRPTSDASIFGFLWVADFKGIRAGLHFR
jgi:hypothetical protein